MPKSAKERAAANLRKVVKAVKGTESSTGTVTFRVKDYCFKVTNSHIAAAYRAGNFLGRTCYTVNRCLLQALAEDEWKASAILALHNKPTLFKYWKNHPRMFAI